MRLKAVVALWAAFAPVLFIAGWARYKIEARPENPDVQLREVMMVPPGRVIRQLDLGYHTLAADLLFIRANLYYGHHILTDEEFPWLGHLIEVLLALDPEFKKIYLWGSMVTTFNKRVWTYIQPELYQRAIKILEQGMARYPDDYHFPMQIAFNLYYDLGEPDSALPYFERAANLPGSPRWLREKLVDLYSKKGQIEMAGRILEEMIGETDDPLVSGALKDRLAYLNQLDRRQESLARSEILVKEWKQDFSYLPFSLYLLLREP